MLSTKLLTAMVILRTPAVYVGHHPSRSPPMSRSQRAKQQQCLTHRLPVHFRQNLGPPTRAPKVWPEEPDLLPGVQPWPVRDEYLVERSFAIDPDAASSNYQQPREKGRCSIGRRLVE